MDSGADLNPEKMEFYQNVSYELRTPVDGAAGPLQNLLAATRPDPRTNNWICGGGTGR